MFHLVGLTSFIMFLIAWKGVFTFKIDKNYCYAIWSVSKLKFKKSIDRSKITDVKQIIYRRSYTNDEVSGCDVAITFGKGIFAIGNNFRLFGSSELFMGL